MAGGLCEVCYNESRRCTLYIRNRTRPQAAPPPPVRRSEPKAARRVGAPRPEAEPARARPQAGARDCAEPEEQGGASQPVTAAQESSARHLISRAVQNKTCVL